MRAVATALGLLSVIAMSAAAQPADPPIGAPSLEPCTSACGTTDKTMLSIDGAGRGRGRAVTVPTSMQEAGAAAVNPNGRIVATGTTAGAVGVVAVIDPRARRRVAEFWTLIGGISPDARFVAFTRFTGLHFRDALYGDTMVYLYDTTQPEGPGTDSVLLPKGARPVYPAELPRMGARFMRETDPRDVMHVFSTDLKWTSPRSVSFFAGPQPQRGDDATYMIHPVTITLSGGGGLDRTTITAPPIGRRTCDRRKVKSRRYDDLVRACARQAHR